MTAGGDASRGEPLKLREQAYEGYTRSLLAREIAPGPVHHPAPARRNHRLPARRHPRAGPPPRGRGPDPHRAAPRHAGAAGRPQPRPQRLPAPPLPRGARRSASTPADADASRGREPRAPRTRRSSPAHERGDDANLMEDAEAVDLQLARDDHRRTSATRSSANAYRVNWIKIKLIRLSETRLYVPMIPQVIGEHLADHRGDRGPRRRTPPPGP